MATVKDANLLLSGLVVGVYDTQDYETKQTNGAAVLVTGENGLASVRLDLAQLSAVRPDFGQRVAWMVALTPYRLDGRDAQLSVKYVRPVTGADIEGILSVVSEPAASK